MSATAAKRKNKHAVALGRLGGKASSTRKAAAARQNARKVGKPCVCGHLTSRHKWQRDGSRKACKNCPCLRYTRT